MVAQIKSRERVAKRGEVFTAKREVNAMLDLVKPECIRPDSRFLEPACGDGNFLAPILERKLKELQRKYRKSSRDFEKLSIVAIGSLYGIDIQQDNVQECRDRLYKTWNKYYTRICKEDTSEDCRDAARFIISKNIILGNALTLMCVDAEGEDTDRPIVFSEWTLIGRNQMQRSDYEMSELINKKESNSAEEVNEEGSFLQRYITNYKKVQDYGEKPLSSEL